MSNPCCNKLRATERKWNKSYQLHHIVLFIYHWDVFIFGLEINEWEIKTSFGVTSSTIAIVYEIILGNQLLRKYRILCKTLHEICSTSK